MIERPLGQLGLAADAIHDLQVLLALGHVRDEIEEVVRLAVEAQRVETPQHEGAVADPRVAIVPVALAPDRLRQRGRRGREQGARGAVGEPLQGQRAALEVALPRVFRELPAIDPLAPVVRRSLDALERLFGRGRSRVLLPVLLGGRVSRPRPDHRHVGFLALAQGLRGVGARTLEAHPQVGDQPHRHVHLTTTGDRLAVAGSRIFPLGRRAPVVEDRLAVEAYLDVSHHAAGGPQKNVLRLVIGRRPAVGPGTPLAVIPGADAKGVTDDHPAGPGPPGRLQDERAGQVAPAGGNLHARRAEPEAARRPVEHGGKHAGAVGPGKAHPLQPPAGGDQGVHLAVGEEGVVGDRRESARDPRRLDSGARLELISRLEVRSIAVDTGGRTANIRFHRLH